MFCWKVSQYCPPTRRNEAHQQGLHRAGQVTAHTGNEIFLMLLMMDSQITCSIVYSAYASFGFNGSEGVRIITL
jgi:hypothetical protein